MRVDPSNHTSTVPLAGRRDVGEHVAVTVLPGGVPDAVVGRVGLPHAETALMFGDEHDVSSAERDCRLGPLIGVELRGIDLREWRGEIVRLKVLPGIGREMNEHPKLEILPGELIDAGMGKCGLGSGSGAWESRQRPRESRTDAYGSC